MRIYNARDYAIELAENGIITYEHLAIASLKYMSEDDVRDMLDANEISPKFFGEDEDEDENEE
jgi:hypothetical protein